MIVVKNLLLYRKTAEREDDDDDEGHLPLSDKIPHLLCFLLFFCFLDTSDVSRIFSSFWLPHVFMDRWCMRKRS